MGVFPQKPVYLKLIFNHRLSINSFSWIKWVFSEKIIKHLTSMNKQVLPTLYSQIREKKILNKCALSPYSWTILIRLELGRGWEGSSAELWQNLLFYRTALERKPRTLGLIWEWIVEPGNPVRKRGWGIEDVPCPSLFLLFSFFVWQGVEKR